MGAKCWEPEAENRTAKPPLAVDASSVWTEAAGAECSIEEEVALRPVAFHQSATSILHT